MPLDVKLAAALLAFFKDDKTHVNEASQIMFLLIDEQMGATGKVARGRQVLNALTELACPHLWNLCHNCGYLADTSRCSA